MPGVEESSLVANVHQSRGINGREADVLPLTVNPPATNGVEESGKYCAYYVHKLLDSSVAFLSCSSGTAPSNELRLNTHQVTNKYLEQHFRSSICKDVRSPMHKTYAVPRTPVIKVPKLDHGYSMVRLLHCRTFG